MLFMTIILIYSGCTTVGFSKSKNNHYVDVLEPYTTLWTSLHLIFHILGRYHEHQREDRDKYVRIVKKNIMKGTVQVFVQNCIAT